MCFDVELAAESREGEGFRASGSEAQVPKAPKG
jgi:hypothetical protein